MTASGTCTYLFETTHHAMWAEEIAREEGIPAEVVGAPADAKAKCGLALRILDAHCRTLELAMSAQGVEFRTYAGSV
jgi:hypothetical protein